MTELTSIDYHRLDDLDLAQRVADRDVEAVKLVTERNNQRLFRAAWSILRNRAEAEDAVQSAYLRAFAGIGSFAGRSSLSTWLTRIVINEALGRERSARRRRAHLQHQAISFIDDYRDKLMRGSLGGASPDGELARAQLRDLLERAIGQLPAEFRLVFVMREIEGMSVEEAAEALDVVPATIKTRHLRARRRLQAALAPEVKAALTGDFPFAGASCEAMTDLVVRRFCQADPSL